MGRPAKTSARAHGFGGVASVGVPAGTCVSIETPLRAGVSGSEATIGARVADTRDGANVEQVVTDALERADRLAFLWSVLDRALVPRQAEIVRLHYRDGLTLSEIAARRGESVQSVRNGHRSALLRLRANVGSGKRKGGSGTRRAATGTVRREGGRGKSPGTSGC